VVADYRDNGAWPFDRWNVAAEGCRARAAALLGAHADEVAFVKNTTAGLMLVAESIPWREGDNVVIADIEFPANVYPWLNLERRGVQVRFVNARDHLPTVDDYAAVCDERTRAIAASWVQFSTGQVTDVAELAELAHRSGGYLVVDAIQGLGALRMDVEALGIDFLSADGHKWLLSVEGHGLLYVSSRVIGELEPFWRGWMSVPRPLAFLEYAQPARSDARRFEEGAANILGIVALDASIGLLLEIGTDVVEERVLAVTQHLIDRLQELGCDIVGPVQPARRSGIVCARVPGASSDDLVPRLRERGIVTASRAGAVRFSPHFYNTQDQIDGAVEALSSLMEPRS
jgi:selenocysteine lyase/cysteine desulfurase